MKAFAHNMLEDLLGHKLSLYSETDITEFSERVAYEISRQLWTAEFFDNLACSGTSSGHGLFPEHIVRVNLEYKDQFVEIRDEFDWDISNPQNEYDFLFS